MIYSFDIFDTLVTRKTASPSGIFAVVQHLLRECRRDGLPIELAEEFYYYRTTAEKEVRRQSGKNEITLDQIYKKIHEYFEDAVDWKEISFLRDMEVETELKYSLGISQNIQKVHDLLDRNERVVFISDMYLPLEVIRKLLNKASPKFENCRVYLSCDVGKTKKTGDLFDHVCAEENVSPRQLHHLGDNKHSDYDVPRSKGINAEWFPGAPLSELERSFFRPMQLFDQFYAGTSRRFRLEHTDANSRQKLGATLVAPVLYGFVEETLKNAKQNGIERLYFLARDGQILLKIAKKINQTKHLGLDLRYLYCARQVCHFAAIFQINARIFDWLAVDYTKHTMTEIALRLNMEVGEFASCLPPELQKGFSSPTSQLSNKYLAKLREFLLNDPRLKSAVLAHAGEYRNNFIQYLAQEGVFDADRIAVVDMGWTGGMQDSFFKIARTHKPDMKMTGYYFSLHETSPCTSRNNEKSAYAFLEKLPRTHLPINLLELLTTADHGTTYGYQKDSKGVWQPMLRPAQHLIQWGVADLHEGIEWFVDEYLSLYSNRLEIPEAGYGSPATQGVCARSKAAAHTGGISASVPETGVSPKTILGKLMAFLVHPTGEIAETFGSILFSSDQNDQFLRESAPPFRWWQMFFFFFGGPQIQNNITFWEKGSLARSSCFTKMIYYCLSAIRMVLRKTRHFWHGHKS